MIWIICEKDENVNDTVFDIVKSIAFINVKKIAGGKSTLPTNLRNAYLLNQELLLKQIEVYKPDVVIGGGTMPLFLKDLNLEEYKEEGNNLKYYIKESKFLSMPIIQVIQKEDCKRKNM
ncbi:MAG: hypothetical protein IPF75_00070 [Bacteroidetes bacterium]|nr:hypothetical protein [Bacteroidota bacterium]